MRHLTNRARFLCAGGAAFAGGLLAAAPVSAAAPAGPQPTPDEALRRLTDGNRRYMADAAIYCNRNYDRRLETAKGQMPFAIVLSCSDSRVPAEIVFDQRVGDLFLVRVAGNIAEPAGIASIEYAVSHFHSPLLMVVGHESCGAVEATLDVLANGSVPPGHIATLTDAIAPAVRGVPKGTDMLDQAVRANARYVARELPAQSTIVADAVRESKLHIVAAYYSFADGAVVVI
ncbi:MAG TPA: carbonic anhydrase [Candidatus Eremiobacteraceae bacterium]|nr:carbonic anhydrase [Candidatus Eremiobacteraceae bacterium]